MGKSLTRGMAAIMIVSMAANLQRLLGNRPHSKKTIKAKRRKNWAEICVYGSGVQEMERRRRQIAKGMISPNQIYRPT